MKTENQSLLQTIIISVAILGLGYFLGNGIQNFNRHERVISVRGLAEKEVDSNVAVWKIQFNVSSNQMQDVKSQLPIAQQAVQDFLIEQGFSPEELTKGAQIKDREAAEYGSEKGMRFVASAYYSVKTDQVAKVESAEQKIDDILKKGVVVTGSQKNFYFTNLNDIKPEMLDEATRNARQAAEGFSKSMSVQVGKMKSASQGVFSVENPLGAEGGYEYGSSSGSTLKKKVRVVTQVEFYVE